MEIAKLVYITYIRSTPKEVWAAITKPEFHRSILGENDERFRLEEGLEMGTSQSENEVWITGKVLESTPPKRLVLSWADPDDLKDKSRVTFELEAMEDMVCLTVIHGKFQGRFDDG